MRKFVDVFNVCKLIICGCLFGYFSVIFFFAITEKKKKLFKLKNTWPLCNVMSISFSLCVCVCESDNCKLIQVWIDQFRFPRWLLLLLLLLSLFIENNIIQFNESLNDQDHGVCVVVVVNLAFFLVISFQIFIFFYLLTISLSYRFFFPTIFISLSVSLSLHSLNDWLPFFFWFYCHHSFIHFFFLLLLLRSI